jgi:hypothetical protein
MRRFLPIVLWASCSTWTQWTQTGSLYRNPCTHVGIRPASDAIDEWAVTVQVSTEWGPCNASADAGKSTTDPWDPSRTKPE